MKIFIDTNVLLRFFLADHQKHFQSVIRLFKKAKDNEVSLITNIMIITELVWTLRSYYKLTKDEIVNKLKEIVSLDFLEISSKNILLAAIDYFENKNIDFIDALSAAWMKEKNLDTIFSFDRDFEKIEGIKRLQS